MENICLMLPCFLSVLTDAELPGYASAITPFPGSGLDLGGWYMSSCRYLKGGYLRTLVNRRTYRLQNRTYTLFHHSLPMATTCEHMAQTGNTLCFQRKVNASGREIKKY